MGSERHDKALREFKHILQDLVYLIRTSTGADTTYLVWVNKQRQQFVWEADSTVAPNVIFADRIQFEQFYLDDYKDITEPLTLEVGVDVPKEKLKHYFDFIPVTQSIVIPFLNKGETVALTVIETEKPLVMEQILESILAYNNAIANVLNTYLELVDLDEVQKRWESYEELLNTYDFKMHKVDLIRKVMQHSRQVVPTSTIQFVAKGYDIWNTVFTLPGDILPMPLGMQLEEKSLAYQALESGGAVFTMHFNHTPKRLSSREQRTEGATLAIPVLINSRRQGLFLVFDEDPLVFNEAIKHKLSNLVRIASLNIQSSEKNGYSDILTNEYGAFIPDLWEKAVENELELNRPDLHTWFGLITPENLSALRTKLRLEELQMMQQDVVSLIHPSAHDMNGIIGFHSDYIYAYLIQSESPDAVEHWLTSINARVSGGFELSDGQEIEINFKTGYTRLDPEHYADSHAVLTAAKKGLNEAVKSDSEQHVLI
jgi:hypothetical protein